MVLLQLDFIEVASREGAPIPYESHWIRTALKHCITLDYGVVTDITPDVRLTFYNAGHILGSAIAHFHIGEGLYNIAFTGDFKFERTRLFDKAETNFPRLEALIMEATYAYQEHPPRKIVEEKLVRIIKETIERDGNVVIPVFAVGRAAEILLVLCEHNVKYPIYLDGMAKKAVEITLRYPELLKDHSALKRAMDRVIPIYTLQDRKLALKNPSIILKKGVSVSSATRLDISAKSPPSWAFRPKSIPQPQSETAITSSCPAWTFKE
jgi:predicted metal-dependent RNase